MTREMLNEFVEKGYLDPSVTELFDPYYEPSWWVDENEYHSDESYAEIGTPALSFSDKGGW